MVHKRLKPSAAKYPSLERARTVAGETKQSRKGTPAKSVPLAVPMQKPSPIPAFPSKTRLKLTRIDLDRKDQLEDDLLDIEAELLDAHEAFRAGSGEWSEVVKLDREYRQLIDVANCFIYDIHNDQNDYFAARSERWQKAEKGQAYWQWMDEWDVEISSDELPDPKRVGDLELCALAMLQELPIQPMA